MRAWEPESSHSCNYGIVSVEIEIEIEPMTILRVLHCFVFEFGNKIVTECLSVCLFCITVAIEHLRERL